MGNVADTLEMIEAIQKQLQEMTESLMRGEHDAYFSEDEVYVLRERLWEVLDSFVEDRD